MAQATDGNWYGYFADITMAREQIRQQLPEAVVSVWTLDNSVQRTQPHYPMTDQNCLLTLLA
jgi:hypothetical protein